MSTGRPYDPFSCRSRLARRDERRSSATGICLVIVRDPNLTAKEVATLDRLSCWTLPLRLGVGWTPMSLRTNARPTRRAEDPARAHLARRTIWTDKEPGSTASAYASTISGPIPSPFSSPPADHMAATPHDVRPCRRFLPGRMPSCGRTRTGGEDPRAAPSFCRSRARSEVCGVSAFLRARPKKESPRWFRAAACSRSIFGCPRRRSRLCFRGWTVLATSSADPRARY